VAARAHDAGNVVIPVHVGLLPAQLAYQRHSHQEEPEVVERRQPSVAQAHPLVRVVYVHFLPGMKTGFANACFR
jgi:hypothetical protein